jgi:CubicO group peptidase (beta-lactamase class C family)
MTNRISEFLQSRIAARDFPSAVYLVAEKGLIVFQDALGNAVVEPERIAARLDTIYDLASLTKVLVTGLLAAMLLETGELNLSDKISKYFSEFDTDEKREITIENLLTHTSGFKAWRPFYLYYDLRWGLEDLVLNESPEIKPCERVVYSDFNFILLTILFENLFGESLKIIAERQITRPLNLQNTFFNPPKEMQKRIAASEKGNEFEKNTCIEQVGYSGDTHYFRDYQIWGEVHDGNSYFMQGVSGHAGLFSTAEETFKIAQQFLAEETVLLKPETCELFRTNFTKGLNEARSIAFQLAETPDSTASKALAKDSFGHLGFTGTSLWIEPETERIFILLTNRTHAHELPFVNINSVRRKFHELAQESLSPKPQVPRLKSTN